MLHHHALCTQQACCKSKRAKPVAMEDAVLYRSDLRGKTETHGNHVLIRFRLIFHTRTLPVCIKIEGLALTSGHKKFKTFYETR